MGRALWRQHGIGAIGFDAQVLSGWSRAPPGMPRRSRPCLTTSLSEARSEGASDGDFLLRELLTPCPLRYEYWVSTSLYRTLVVIPADLRITASQIREGLPVVQNMRPLIRAVRRMRQQPETQRFSAHQPDRLLNVNLLKSRYLK